MNKHVGSPVSEHNCYVQLICDLSVFYLLHFSFNKLEVKQKCFSVDTLEHKLVFVTACFII